MDVTDLFMILFYGVAVFFVILFLFSLFNKPSTSIPPQIVIIDEQPNVSSWWPWTTTTYNAWPYWTGWWSGGGSGGYYPRRWNHPGPHPLLYPSSRPWGGGGRHANSGAPRGPSGSGGRSGTGAGRH